MSLELLRKRLDLRREELRQMRIAVLAGGSSSEREVSLVSGSEVTHALVAAGFLAEMIEVSQDDVSFRRVLAETPETATSLPPEQADAAPSALTPASEHAVAQYLRQVQMVLTTLHGTRGEDGAWQGLLELLRVPFVSANVRGSTLGMDKLTSKRLFCQLGIPTPLYWVFRPGHPCRHDVPRDVKELVAKPRAEGSSVGIVMVCNDDRGWKSIEEQVRQFGTMVIEKRILGREVTAGVIGHEDEPIALPLVEIKPKERKFYDYHAKYSKGETEYVCPASFEEAVTRRVHEYALTIYRELSLEPYARIDCILDSQDAPWFLEANTLPGFTPLSLLPQAAAAAGIGFAELLELLMLIALERWERQWGESA